MNIVKGQKIWIWLDRRLGNEITETTVKSVGSRYITTTYGIKYHVDTLREVNGCGNPSFIILDLEKYEKEQYYKATKNKLSRFSWNNLENDDVDKVYSIIKEYL